jgi:hypothetical protein
MKQVYEYNQEREAYEKGHIIGSNMLTVTTLAFSKVSLCRFGS